MNSVTVFVRRVGGIFLAHSHAADAANASSATLAARACAARSLGVPETEIELTPESEFVMIGTIKALAPAKRDWRCLVAVGWVLIATLVLVVTLIALFGGGAS